jgi:tripartite-type tricarboxylate transporter receptor subunit TctC
MTNKRSFLTALAAAALAGPAFAQDAAPQYPTKPIRMIVNFPAGGTVDALARAVGDKLAQRWGKPVIVDNRPGAGGNIGAQLVASADGDGYTLLATPPGPLSINEYLYKQLAYDPAKLEPVVLLAGVPNAITARRDFPANSLKELIAYVKAHPGKVTYGSQGNGSTSHLTGQMFANTIGGDMVHVPFKGEGPALTELLGGRIDLFFGNISAVLKYRASKQVKVLALAAEKPGFMAPDVPIAAEGGMADFLSSAWFAISAPPGTPKPIVEKLNAALNDIMKMPEVRERFAAQGAEVMGGSPANMAAFVNRERVRWKAVIQSAGVKID